MIEAHLARTIDRIRGSSPIYEMIRYHFGYDEPGASKPGKRLRPQLLLRTALEEGGTLEAALDAAVAIEILHNYSLVHDDIEDNDELLHGRTTIWAQYGVPHGINAVDALCAISSAKMRSIQRLLWANPRWRTRGWARPSNASSCP